MSNQSLPPGASSPRDDRPGAQRGRAPRWAGEVPERTGDRAERAAAPRAGARGSDGGDTAEDRAAPSGGGSSSSTMAMLLNAMSMLCCANVIFGIPGIVFAVRAAHKRDRGRMAEAETLTRYSWYCLGAGAVFFVTTLILFGVLLTQAGSWIQGVSPVDQW
ncbi:hypothetical protein CLV63_103395 [Murinocardiopsis flavida]|uniref:Interferon-induced transmembrane protein n=1 Tax=Murinocardiopsis flavida TaxID=645275 RepID=A0A2P8DR22_9ACTN|nr:hypothetical protein [Murinocardiopsis flavida]PSK99668.1 hypothetical protein CLV63_103395 [Murinocardiopsis flavida]